jgi:hypothetical protein
MRILSIAIMVALCAACGRKLGPGKTPKETIRNFEMAMKKLDVGAAYDMLSSRTRAQIDAVMNNMKASLAVIPDSALDQVGLAGLKNMEPREILATAIDRAKEMNPSAVDALRTFQLVVLEVKEYGDEASVKVATIFNGQDNTDTVPMLREGGRWYIDSDESLNAVPMNFAPDLEASATPT